MLIVCLRKSISTESLFFLGIRTDDSSLFQCFSKASHLHEVRYQVFQTMEAKIYWRQQIWRKGKHTGDTFSINITCTITNVTTICVIMRNIYLYSGNLNKPRSLFTINWCFLKYEVNTDLTTIRYRDWEKGLIALYFR